MRAARPARRAAHARMKARLPVAAGSAARDVALHTNRGARTVRSATRAVTTAVVGCFEVVVMVSGV